MKRPLFRKKLNTAIASYKKTSAQILATNKRKEQNAELTLNRIRLVNANRSDKRSFSDSALTDMARTAHGVGRSSELTGLHNAKGEAIKSIQEQSKLRKAPLRGNIRLIYAGRKARARLSNSKLLRKFD